MKWVLGALAAILSLLVSDPALAGSCSAYPFTLTNGQLADANQVMADFNLIRNCAITSLAASGANSDITSLTGLTTPLSVAQGGTGSASGAVGGVLSGSLPNPGFASVANGTVIANVSGGPAASSATTLAAFTAAQPAFVGDSGSGGTQGLVPAPPAGSNAAGKFLSANGTFAPVILSTMEVRNQQPTNTGSGETITAGSYIQRVLNTVAFNSITGASLSANQVTLPAGTYVIYLSVPVGASAASSGYATQSMARLRNVTDSTTPCITTISSVSRPGGSTFGDLMVSTARCITSIGGNKVFELDTFVNNVSAVLSGGVAFATGDPNVYGDVVIEKVG